MAIQEDSNFGVVERDPESQIYHDDGLKYSTNVAHISPMVIFGLTNLCRSTLIEILANQEQLNKGVAAINAKMEASRIELQRLAAGEFSV